MEIVLQLLLEVCGTKAVVKVKAFTARTNLRIKDCFKIIIVFCISVNSQFFMKARDYGRFFV